MTPFPSICSTYFICVVTLNDICYRHTPFLAYETLLYMYHRYNAALYIIYNVFWSSIETVWHMFRKLDHWCCLFNWFTRLEKITPVHRLLFINTDNNYQLLNVYCEIFGTSSYGDGRTSLRVHLRHMNECRIYYIPKKIPIHFAQE